MYVGVGRSVCRGGEDYVGVGRNVCRGGEGCM